MLNYNNKVSLRHKQCCCLVIQVSRSFACNLINANTTINSVSNTYDNNAVDRGVSVFNALVRGELLNSKLRNSVS